MGNNHQSGVSHDEFEPKFIKKELVMMKRAENPLTVGSLFLIL